ncbi:MAG: LEPR-XLL domain-containing protein [Planctomycetota bacterium]
MSNRNVVRSVTSGLSRGARSLLSSAGHAERRSDFEALEPRILLSGDHPGIDEIFPDSGPPTATPTVIDISSGSGTAAGTIEDVPDDSGDFFSFTSATGGFVSVLALAIPPSGGGTAFLDTAVEVFLPDGTELTGETDGLNNGTLERAGLVQDGWFGFVADAGQEYFVRVIGENRDEITSPSTQGVYSLIVNNNAATLTLDANGIARTGSDTGDAQTLVGFQDERLYTFTTPNDAAFNSLGYVLSGDVVFGDDADGYASDGTAARDLVDTQIEVFDSNGVRLVSDSDSGHIYDAFAPVQFEADSTYFVRVRSDAISAVPESGDPFDGDLNAGDFELRVQARATEVAFDADTRIGVVDRSSGGVEVATGIAGAVPVDPAGLLRDQHSAQVFSFTSLGEGDAIVTFLTYGNDPAPYTPFLDPKVTVYDDSGSLVPIDSNDTLSFGDAFDRAGLRFLTEADTTYFVIVDVFDGQFLGTGIDPRDASANFFDYRLAIESPANIERIPNGDGEVVQPVDDHIDFLTETNADDEVIIREDEIRQLATPLVWSNSPFLPVGFIDGTSYLADGSVLPVPNMIPDAYDDGAGGLAFSLLGRPENGEGGFTQSITDHSRVVQAFATGRLDSAADTDVFQFVPQVDMLGTFEGGIDLQSGTAGEGDAPEQTWFLGGRPASRLTVNVFFEAEWFQLGGTTIQIFDSNFQLVDETTAVPIGSVNAGLPEAGNLLNPSGIESPSLLGPAPTEGVNIDLPRSVASVNLDSQYWGGEAYYLVVSTPDGQNETRYTAIVQADAFDEFGTFAADTEEPDAGEFSSAPELVFNPFTGLATNFNNLESTAANRTFTGVNSGRGEIDDDTGDFVPDDDFFNEIVFTGELGMIHAPDDTDLFRFTAPRDGTAEILVATTGLTDTFVENFNLVGVGTIESQNFSKTYNSPLDAALRIFDSTGNEIGFVDNFSGFGDGTNIDFTAGGVASLDFSRKDPRIVIDVEEGQEYFVQVESSQRDQSLAETDWLVATGSYQLIVNTTPNAGAGDDHVDFPFGGFGQTVIPANGLSTIAGTNNAGTVEGTIENDLDADAFEYLSPVAGAVSFTLDPEPGLSLSLLIIDGDGNFVPLINSTALDGELLVGTFVADQGERFSLLVGGIGGTGDYTLTLNGTPVTDDAADTGNFSSAAELITFGAFDREVEFSGVINDNADTDLFTFTAPVTDPITLTLSGDSPVFAPTVIVYEISSDPSLTASPDQNQPVRTPVAYDLNPTSSGTLTVTFSAQAGREYHVLVGSQSGSGFSGGYNGLLTYTPEDDHADLGDLVNATFINVVPETGLGSEQGVLEQINDSDLFVFGTPASGPVDVSLVWDAVPGSSFELRIFDIDGNLLDPDGAAPQDVFVSSTGFLAIDGFNAGAGEIFYVSVVGPSAAGIQYTLNVNTGLLDDHANEGDLADATVIPLDFASGDGSESGRLEVDDDTDLFTFGIAAGASADVFLTDTSLGSPIIRAFDASGNLLATTPIAGGVTVTNATAEDGQFFVSVSSTFPGPRSGVYTINVDGEPVPPPPGDDHANEGDLANATVLNVSQITGNASQGGVINGTDGNPVVDTDLFRYTSTAAGAVFAQVSVPGRPAEDFTIRVFDADGVELTDLADSAGLPGSPGVTASTSFTADAAGETFFLLVESTNNADAGAYALNVDGQASTSIVYYPEGFANASIQQFVSLANPNSVAVDYTVRVYYADTSIPSAVVASGTLDPDARGGATLSFGDGTYAPGIVPNEAYSIVIESDLRIAAGLSHYDAGLVGRTDSRGAGAIGEAFTDQVANEWLFPNVERNPGVVAQFLVYFNPNPFDVDVTITAVTATGEVVLPMGTLEANQRGGLEVHTTPALPIGTFAVRITSEATDPANEPNNLGIVAATSFFDLVADTAYGYLGVGDGGSELNVITSLTSGGGASSRVDLYNPTDTDASVEIVGSYLLDDSLPDLRRTITLGAGRVTSLTGFDLAFVPGSPIGLEIISDQALAVSSVEVQRGDAAASAAVTQAGTEFFFGDAFINPLQAGSLYAEALSFYNPGTEDTNVTVTVLFADGTAQRTLTRMVEAQEFLRLDLQDLPEVVGARPQLNFFSLRVEATTAIVSQLSHFDGVLGGGWLTTGAPLGLTNPIV